VLNTEYASPKMSIFAPEDRFSAVVAVGPGKNEFYQRSPFVLWLLAWLDKRVKGVEQ
jgi:hypothetical protein